MVCQHWYGFIHPGRTTNGLIAVALQGTRGRAFDLRSPAREGSCFETSKWASRSGAAPARWSTRCAVDTGEVAGVTLRRVGTATQLPPRSYRLRPGTAQGTAAGWSKYACRPPCWLAQAARFSTAGVAAPGRPGRLFVVLKRRLAGHGQVEWAACAFPPRGFLARLELQALDDTADGGQELPD